LTPTLTPTVDLQEAAALSKDEIKQRALHRKPTSGAGLSGLRAEAPTITALGTSNTREPAAELRLWLKTAAEQEQAAAGVGFGAARRSAAERLMQALLQEEPTLSDGGRGSLPSPPTAASAAITSTGAALPPIDAAPRVPYWECPAVPPASMPAAASAGPSRMAPTLRGAAKVSPEAEEAAQVAGRVVDAAAHGVPAAAEQPAVPVRSRVEPPSAAAPEPA